MTIIKGKNQVENNKSIDTAVARVRGAVQVASVAVSASMAIKDEALDEVESLRTASNMKARDHAVKKIKTNIKKLKGGE